MNVATYINELNRQFSTGGATEHTYRPALKALLETVSPDILATNEPKQIDCGAPDFVITRSGIPLGYIEAKKIGVNLDKQEHKEQLRRYSNSLDNLIFTNYIEFRLFRRGEQVLEVRVADIFNGRVKVNPNRVEELDDLFKTFIAYQGHVIATAEDLAGRMAAKARMLSGVIVEALRQEKTKISAFRVDQMGAVLENQIEAFRKHLIHDIQFAEFADIYAQTVAYGMFAARLNDSTSDTFSRKEAADLIPASNPFLLNFFRHIAGYDLDERIRWIVDELANMFRAADVPDLMKDYGKSTQQNDPFIHFYETFLGQYNPKMRKSRGVYYTPEPVVNFIVRAVDSILQDEYGLPQGLASTKKITADVDLNSRSNDFSGESQSKITREIHKVQILDPATGTGTFLAAIIQYIFHENFYNQEGIWPDYVREHLLPRLNGFEVLMASYAMAHIKLKMTLNETGYEREDRLRVFLTNSLEEFHDDAESPFSQWLSIEANQANAIKRDTPVMVVIGNPPYSGESANKGKWINDLLKIYKREPDTENPLQEKNPKWINDDYVKFIRYGQHYIDRSGEGILAYINNHSFLDAPTFRGMRSSLLQSFDKIYIIDLHGNSKKKENIPNGVNDKNVFDIQQGVSINIFLKTRENNNTTRKGKIFHYDLYGERETKYEFLRNNDICQIDFQKIEPRAPQYYFVPKDYKLHEEYEEGFPINDLFQLNSLGITTARDKFTIHFSPTELHETISKFCQMDDETARQEFSLGKDAMDWKISFARQDLEKNVLPNENKTLISLSYRPFDVRYTYYTGNVKGFHCRPRKKIMKQFIQLDNVGLVLCRNNRDGRHAYFLSNTISDKQLISSVDNCNVFPLYIYSDDVQLNLDDKMKRKSNFNLDIVKIIEKSLDLKFSMESQNDDGTFSSIDVLDYIYAVLHSCEYRQRFDEFLRTDFPRIPYPKTKNQFRKLSEVGMRLRSLHLLESKDLEKIITSYPEPGENKITMKPKYENACFEKNSGRVYINEIQYFGGIHESVWNFWIGGYQPAQKWLNDRRGRVLNHDEVIHYQKIIVALVETNKLMKQAEELF